MANRIIVDKIDGVHHIYSDNGGNMLQAEGEYHSDKVAHAAIQIVIAQMPGNVLSDMDVIEFVEDDQPPQIIKIYDYLSKI